MTDSPQPTLSVEEIRAARKKKIIKETRAYALIFIVVFAFRSSFFEPYRIPSGSMIPTLMIGDFILVNKFSYGFKIPFSDLAIFDLNWDPIYLFGKKSPKRGDVIVFKYPEQPNINYIKRVVGTPGDMIEIVNNVVYINDKAIETTQLGPEESKFLFSDMDEKFSKYSLKFFKAKIGDATPTIQFADEVYSRRDMQRTRIPDRRYFAMGDNRDFSADSRFWGFVPEEYIRGKAIVVWFSLIFGLDGDSFKFRPKRIGNLIK